MKNKILAFGTLMSLLITVNLYANKDKQDRPMEKRQNRFEVLDINKDGKISKEEWSAHFSEMDLNKDESIDKEEMNKHHENMQGRMHEQMHHGMGDQKGK